MRLTVFLGIALLITGCLSKLENASEEVGVTAKDTLHEIRNSEKLQTKGGSLELLRDDSSPRWQVLGALKLILEVTDNDEVHRYVGAHANLYTELSIFQAPNVTVIADKFDPMNPLISGVNDSMHLALESATLTSLFTLLNKATNKQLTEQDMRFIERLFYAAPAILGARRWEQDTHRIAEKPVILGEEGNRAGDPHTISRVCGAKALLKLESGLRGQISAAARDHLFAVLESNLDLSLAEIGSRACPFLQEK